MGVHIVSSFDDDLLKVQAKIAEMGGLAEDQMRKALDAVSGRDIKLAEEVILQDKRIDLLEVELNDLATQIIALRAPMAEDLRVLISALKVASTLERIGDLSKNIARRAAPLTEIANASITNSITQMGRATLNQLSAVLDAYSERDAEQAVAIWYRDVEIDDMYNAIFRELVTYMMEDNRTIGLGSQLLFVAKNLERVGDHTTHISEMIYYIVHGEPLGDERPKGVPHGLHPKT